MKTAPEKNEVLSKNVTNLSQDKSNHFFSPLDNSQQLFLKNNSFAEYYALTDYQRQCLPATNYWREQNGKPLITVPETDLHYKKYFKASVNDCKKVEVIPPPQQETQIELPKFSFFRKPIKNTIPYKNIDLLQLYEIIRNPKYYKAITDTSQTLYKEHGKTEPYKTFKEKNFDYVTFSGTFTKRNNESLISHSGYYCLDKDYLKNAEQFKRQVISINDTFFETEFCFVSPCGFGVKWVISVNSDYPHETTFKWLQEYIKGEYDITIDNTPDISRACFICHDANCFINPKYLNQ